MLRILIVSKNLLALQDLSTFLTNDSDTEVLRAVSGQEALAIIGRESVDAVVVDEILADGLALPFVRAVTKLQPLINCAMVSPLAQEDFHEATEGLGIFMHLPVEAGAKEAEMMLKMIKTIEVLMTL